MAKAKKFGDNYMWVIKPTTKNTTWKYTGSGNSGYYRLDVQYSVKDLKTYSETFYNVPTRKGNDLVVKTIFLKKNNSTKTVTTTIKNFFTDIWTNGSDMEIQTCLDGNPYKMYNNFNFVGKNGLFGPPQETSAKDYILASSAKKAVLTLSNGGQDFVVDLKGNDAYILESKSNNDSEYDTVLDIAGNDSYSSSNWNYTKITDIKGSDTYITEDGGKFDVNDYFGNDKYYFYSNEMSEIKDFKGNDKYTIEDSRPSDYDYGQFITDSGGKDSYTITNSRGLRFIDKKGNDKYTIKDIDTKEEDYGKWNFLIADLKGNDRYELTNVSHYSDDLMSNSAIQDNTGNDKYILSVVNNALIGDIKGKDKYTVEQTEKLVIMEHGGSDKYTIKDGSKNIDIKDQGGKDKYSFTANAADDLSKVIQDIYVIDKGKTNDKYNFNYTVNYYARTNDTNYRTVKDDGGNDTYKITDSAFAVIEDISGNDKYNFTATVFGEFGGHMVYDSSGEDTYNLNGTYDKKKKEAYLLYSTGIQDTGANKDTYNINYSQSITISDDGGKNKFNAKNSNNVTIAAEGKNTFNFKNVFKGSIITSGDYKDTYNFTSSSGLFINDTGNANDTYNIKDSAGRISDSGGDDIYNISKMIKGLKIQDDGGNDILKLTDVKKKDIVFMANISEDDYQDNSLILFNKKNNSYICVDNYFSVSDYNITGKSDTAIETIKAGKSTLSVDFNFINQIKSDVSSYLGTGGSVMNVLQNQDTNAEALQDLIAYFTK